MSPLFCGNGSASSSDHRIGRRISWPSCVPWVSTGFQNPYLLQQKGQSIPCVWRVHRRKLPPGIFSERAPCPGKNLGSMFKMRMAALDGSVRIVSDPSACSSSPAPVCQPMPSWPRHLWLGPFYVDKTGLPLDKSGWSCARPLQKAQVKYLLPFFWLPFPFFFLLEVFSLLTQRQ